jgi:putative resolvase
LLSGIGIGFARFGVAHLRAVLTARRRRMEVVDRCEATDDRARAMVDVLTSARARLCARRGARNRAMRALTAANHEPGEAA